MSKDGRIGNRQALKGMADSLQMEGVNRAPDMLNRDQVQPVYDIANGMPGRIITIGQELNTNVAGSPGPSVNLVGDPDVVGFGTPIISNKVNQVRRETRVLAWDTLLVFDAAGALAFNGKEIRFHLRYLQDPVTLNQTIINVHDPIWIVATGQLSYRWALKGGVSLTNVDLQSWGPSTWDGYVPRELILGANVIVDDGTNFPANTFWSNRLTVLQQPQDMNLHQ